jgi:hypothetical protein
MMEPRAALAKYICEKCDDIVMVAGPKPGASGLTPQHLMFIAMGVGVQFALELADYDPTVAKQLLRSIHLGSPEAADEWYANARKFAALCTP